MSDIGIYNFKPVRTGETFKGADFQIKVNGVPKNLNGATITMVIIGNDLTIFSSKNDEIIITNADLGKFRLPKQIITLPPQEHAYYITIVDSAGDRKTYIKGIWPITA
jgi:hypothetical protein